MSRIKLAALAFLAVFTMAAAPSVLGDLFRLSAKDESLFPTPGASTLGAMIYGTDAGVPYWSDGGRWISFAAAASGVTSVTASSPNISSGGMTPNISHLPFDSPIYNDAGTVGCLLANASRAGCLSAADWTAFNAVATAADGGVISVGAISPVTSTGGNSPVIGFLPLAAPIYNDGGSVGCQTANASTLGCLSGADWTTFNGKGNGTVTSVTGTNPVISSGGTTPAISFLPFAYPLYNDGGSIGCIIADGGNSGCISPEDWNRFNAKSSDAGTVTIVSVTTANGVSGSVATATTTPAITLTLGAITPTSVNASSGAITGGVITANTSFNVGSSTITDDTTFTTISNPVKTQYLTCTVAGIDMSGASSNVIQSDTTDTNTSSTVAGMEFNQSQTITAGDLSFGWKTGSTRLFSITNQGNVVAVGSLKGTALNTTANDAITMGSTTTTNTISSNTSAATASSSVAAMSFTQTATLDANDLVYRFTNATGSNLLKIDNEGDTVVLGTLAAEALTLNVATPLGLLYGGTGNTLTASAGAVVYSGSGAMGFNAPGTSGQCLKSGGTGAPTWGACDATTTLTGGVTGSGTGTISTTVITNANLTGDVTSSGNATSYSATVPISKGGTNSTTALSSAGGVMWNDGSAIKAVAAGTSGNCWISNGASVPTAVKCPTGLQASSGTLTLNVASTSSGTCATDFDITVTGATLTAGSVCNVNPGFSTAGGIAGMQFTAWASESTHCTVRACCNGSSTCDPLSQDYTCICFTP